MASSTSPDGIVYPDASDPIAPLNAVFQDLAESVQTALDGITPGAENLGDLGDVTITTPADGQLLAYDDGTSEWVNQALTAAQLPAGSILQVVSTTKTDVHSEGISGSGVSDIIPGLTATITPSSTDSKILIMGRVDFDGSIRSGQLFRDTTEIGFGDASGSIRQSHDQTTGTFQFLDSPSTTSAITYGFKFTNSSTGGTTLFINRRVAEQNNATWARTVSTITLMEVAA